MHQFLQLMLDEKNTVDLDGRPLRITGAIAPHEAEFMMSLIEDNSLRTCMETGVAYGVSTVAICNALSRLGGDCMHFGIDPCQHQDYNGAALAALEKCGYERLFELLEGPGHIMLPKLLDRGIKLDFAFIDGWHTFDYTLLDFFYADKMLRPGGFLLIHDLGLPSKLKVWKFIENHRRYRRIKTPAGPAPIGRYFLSLAKGLALLRKDNVKNSIRAILHKPNLLVAQKIEDWEPDFDYFNNF